MDGNALRDPRSCEPKGEQSPASNILCLAILAENESRGVISRSMSQSDPRCSLGIDAGRCMNIGEYINGKAQQPLTPILKSHEIEIGDFSKLCSNLCMKLLHLLAVGLQVSRPLLHGSSLWNR